MKNLFAWAVAGLVATAMAMTGTPAAAAGLTLKGPPKIAIILYAQRNDGGWVQTFDDARLSMQKDLGQDIAYVENIGDSETQIRPAVEKFIEQGYNIIIGSSYGYNDTFKALAAEHPDVAFLNSPGTVSENNLQGFYGRSYQSYFLCGMAAGAMSKSGKLGFVGGFPTSQTLWNVNAMELGARVTNPKATLTVAYISSWSDPAKERATAQALLDQGAEVIGEHINGPTPELTAQDANEYAVAFQRDKAGFAPQSVLCSSAWVWTGYLESAIKKIAAGNWSADTAGGLPGIKEGGTDIVCCNAVLPKDVVADITATRAAIIGGKEVFAGPLQDNTGNERVASGQTLSDADLNKMDWYVDGVTAQK